MEEILSNLWNGTFLVVFVGVIFIILFKQVLRLLSYQFVNQILWCGYWKKPLPTLDGRSTRLAAVFVFFPFAPSCAPAWTAINFLNLLSWYFFACSCFLADFLKTKSFSCASCLYDNLTHSVRTLINFH